MNDVQSSMVYDFNRTKVGIYIIWHFKNTGNYLIFVNLFKKIERAINSINSTVPNTINKKIQIKTLDELIRIQKDANSPIRQTVTHSSSNISAVR